MYGELDFDPTRMMKEMMLRGVSFAPGSVRLYGRKSTPQERGSGVCRSVRQQMTECHKVCRKWGLPATEADEMGEPQGFGGDLLPTGMILQIVEGETAQDTRRRAVLGRLLADVLHKGVRAIVIWAEDRLWRSSKLCAALLDFFMAHDVWVFNAQGPIEFRSVDGYQAVVNRAAAAEAMRKQCSYNAKRGHRDNRERGSLTVGADCLGFRSAGRHSKRAYHVPDEIELARRIHLMFNDGEGDGPMSPQKIARTLMAEGTSWPEELQIKTAIRRSEHTKKTVYPWQVRKVLTDVRLRGCQSHGGQAWPCSEFLIDGQPAIPDKLWERTQAKLEASKGVPNRSREKSDLAGILRCGFCGQAMACRAVNIVTNDGKYKEWYWHTYRNEGWCWCRHSLPSFRASRMNDFVSNALWPLMREQVEHQRTSGGTAAATAELKRIQALQSAKNAELDQLRVLARGSLLTNLSLVAELDAEIRRELQSLSLDEAQCRATLRDAENALPFLGTWEDTPPSLRRDAVRATIRWMAVVPMSAPRIRNQWGGWQSAPLVGKLLICTAWGTLITAVIERAWCGESEKRRLIGFRLAALDECLGSVMDLPDPHGFKLGLERSFAGKKVSFDPARNLPGYIERERLMSDCEKVDLGGQL